MSAANGHRLTYFGDIGPAQRKRWLLGGMYGAGELSCVYGFPGCGKSVVLGDQACAVAAGRPWFGRRVGQGAVLYIAAERGELVKRRFVAWRQRHGMDGLPIGVLEGFFDLSAPAAGIDDIITAGKDLAAHTECPVAWVIVDTKSRVMGGGDPNSDRDIQVLVGNLMRLQVALGGPHVTIVDHVPHGSPERMKGSGALAGAVDVSFLVRKEGGFRSLTIGSKPPNDGPDEMEVLFGLESETIGVDEDGEETTAPVVVAADAGAAMPERPAKPKRLNPAAQRILAAYNRLVDAGRTSPAPLEPGVEPGTQAVTLADLREMAFHLGIFTEPEPAADADPKDRTRWTNGRRQAWKRGTDELQQAFILRIEGEFAWTLARRPTVTNRDEPE